MVLQICPPALPPWITKIATEEDQSIKTDPTASIIILTEHKYQMMYEEQQKMALYMDDKYSTQN